MKTWHVSLGKQFKILADEYASHRHSSHVRWAMIVPVEFEIGTKIMSRTNGIFRASVATAKRSRWVMI